MQSSGLFVHSSGPFGGPFSDWGGGGGGSSEPREPPLATALLLPHCMPFPGFETG